MDYLLGRNALGRSYVTGYGERYSDNQHHRFWGAPVRPLAAAPAGGLPRGRSHRAAGPGRTGAPARLRAQQV